MIYKLIVIFSVFMAACAQMLLKQGAQKQYDTLWRQYANMWVIGGYLIMGCCMLINIFCLSKGVLVKEIGAIESISYLFVPMLSLLFFKESMTLRKVGAIAVIMVGVVIFFW